MCPIASFAWVFPVPSLQVSCRVFWSGSVIAASSLSSKLRLVWGLGGSLPFGKLNLVKLSFSKIKGWEGQIP